jgi:hypothetical protein
MEPMDKRFLIYNVVAIVAMVIIGLFAFRVI